MSPPPFLGFWIWLTSLGFLQSLWLLLLALAWPRHVVPSGAPSPFLHSALMAGAHCHLLFQVPLIHGTPAPFSPVPTWPSTAEKPGIPIAHPPTMPHATASLLIWSSLATVAAFPCPSPSYWVKTEAMPCYLLPPQTAIAPFCPTIAIFLA
jgi:hypothetical protein